jgi:hypothetical protein
MPTQLCRAFESLSTQHSSHSACSSRHPSNFRTRTAGSPSDSRWRWDLLPQHRGSRTEQPGPRTVATAGAAATPPAPVTPAHTPVRDTRGWSTSVAAQTTSRVGPRVGLVAPLTQCVASTRQSTSVHGPASRAERASARNADDAWQSYDPATFETAATTDGGGAAMALEAVGFMEEEDDTALKSIAAAQLNDLTPRTSRKHERAAGKTWRQGLYDSVRAGLVAAAVLASPLCSPSSQSPSALACAAAAAAPLDCGGGAAPHVAHEPGRRQPRAGKRPRRPSGRCSRRLAPPASWPAGASAQGQRRRASGRCLAGHGGAAGVPAVGRSWRRTWRPWLCCRRTLPTGWAGRRRRRGGACCPMCGGELQACHLVKTGGALSACVIGHNHHSLTFSTPVTATA